LIQNGAEVTHEPQHMGSMNGDSMVPPNLLDIQNRRLRKSMIAILSNFIIYFVVFFVQGPKLLA